ncbi:MAG TPA: HepT-like ribonuclease domain-containing protein [Xanthobacteraceae bacterium]|nr:HepT-like ribonuclease domain-containing protein [Xanthobacteraceae bacterium]
MKKYLHDIQESAKHIAEFTAGKTFADYLQNLMLRSAVERKFEIIGEALVQLAKADPAIVAQIDEHRRIIAFRNILVHRYHDVDDQLVWGIVEGKLGVLRRDVDVLLNEQ